MKHNRMFLFLVMVTLALAGGTPLVAASRQPPTASQAYGWMDLSSNLPEPASLSDVHFIGNQGWMTGGKAKIYYTSNGGMAGSFVIQTVPLCSGGPFGDIIHSLFMRSASEGYATTVDGCILHTTDAPNGGWHIIGSPGGAFTSIHFPPSPATTGFTCNNSGEVYTIDGETVVYNALLYGANLSSINFPVTSEEGWVAGGTVIRHYTGGEWRADQNYDNSRGLGSVCFTDNSNGWAVGDYGRILHTANGRDWVIQPNPDPQQNILNDVFFLNPNEGWAVGYNIILHTTDGGAHWNIEAAGLTSGKFLRAVFAVDSHTVYVVGNGVLLKYGAIELPYKAHLPLVIRQ